MRPWEETRLDGDISMSPLIIVLLWTHIPLVVCVEDPMEAALG